VAVVAQDLVWPTIVKDRQLGTALRNSGEIRKEVRRAGEASKSFESLANGRADGDGDAFSGRFGELPGESIGFWVLDAQRHRMILPSEVDSASSIGVRGCGPTATPGGLRCSPGR
jgi:hypothetical protein